MTETDKDLEDSGDRDSTENAEKQRSSAEWISFSIALALLGVVVSLIVYSWLSQSYKPPILIVKTSPEFRQVEQQFYVPFTVTNEGGTTVQSVQVIAELWIDNQLQQQGSQEITFLSKGEVQSGAFIFNYDPSQGELIVRVASYQLP
ncbi:MAG: TIGR02588 family protein [Jaaginema sp. PMC 1079.18]|nr:TIGR02588 family protein [Jaaginema sp. PMC 1080.18]MEC4852188.1 TIGR02588 family protein [Jaaginema sp. PMC 1079.18]MEC4865031.1 TIGR02588 family protein [Jaaginema sp. PMC 1078.18]